MAQELCAICHERPAVVRRQPWYRTAQRRELALCELHYRQLMRQQRMRSPLESLFGGGNPFDEIFSGFGEQSPVTPVRARRRRRRGHRRVFQQADHRVPATRRAVAEFGKREVDYRAPSTPWPTPMWCRRCSSSSACRRRRDLKNWQHRGQRWPRRQQGEASEDMTIATGEERLAARLRPVPPRLGHDYVGWPRRLLLAWRRCRTASPGRP
ncbi:hypothetical protein P4132_20600 [Pseudomonas aeruginosa]|nr:hypothetical protein [Pseudomonas aeruginosa]